jgi:hypothetical protein
MPWGGTRSPRMWRSTSTLCGRLCTLALGDRAHWGAGARRLLRLRFRGSDARLAHRRYPSKMCVSHLIAQRPPNLKLCRRSLQTLRHLAATRPRLSTASESSTTGTATLRPFQGTSTLSPLVRIRIPCPSHIFVSLSLSHPHPRARTAFLFVIIKRNSAQPDTDPPSSICIQIFSR